MKEDKTYKYISRNDDGGGKEIGLIGVAFAALIIGCALWAIFDAIF